VAAPLLIVTSSLGGGGAELHAVRLANELARMGVGVTLAAFRADGAYAQSIAPSVRRARLSKVPWPSSLARACASVVPLRQLVRELRPAAALAVMDVPGVVTLAAAPAGTRVFVNLQTLPESLYPPDGSVLAALLERAARRFFPRATGLVALSAGVKRSYALMLGDAAPPIHVLPNLGPSAAEVSGADRVAARPECCRRVVLACGRLSEEKGFDVLIEAMARLSTAIGAHLWILGTGGLRQTLERQALRLGIAERIHFLGFQRDVWAYYRAADVFALSSRWEGLANVLVEALAAGLPIVATDCDFGPREVLEHGRWGLLVPPENAEALAGALEQVLTSPSMRERLAAEAPVRAMAYSPERIAPAFLSLLLGEDAHGSTRALGD
jgi:glycosyltransferase involved in cell wall biosynthesis